MGEELLASDVARSLGGVLLLGCLVVSPALTLTAAAGAVAAGTWLAYAIDHKRTLTLYHVTDAGCQIQAENKMRRGQDGFAGGGIYFADSIEAAKSKAHSSGHLVTAKVRVGVAKVITSPERWTYTKLKRIEHDSVEVRGLRTGTEYVVYNWDQVEIISVKSEQSCCIM